MRLYGRIEIVPAENGRVSWRILTGVNRARRDVVVEESEWAYLTRTTAVTAAKRWAKRLGITLQQEDSGER